MPMLIILTDQPGLYTADPRSNPAAEFVHQARAGDPALEAMAGAGPRLAKGGMLTKILAAKRGWFGHLHRHRLGGASTTCCALCQGESIGTALLAPTQNSRPASNGCWTTDSCRCSAGRCRCCVAKLQTAGKSLLPSAWWVSGEFSRGDVIAVRNLKGQEIARGLAIYSSVEARLLSGTAQRNRQVLGCSAEPEMLHRDNMVVLH